MVGGFQPWNEQCRRWSQLDKYICLYRGNFLLSIIEIYCIDLNSFADKRRRFVIDSKLYHTAMPFRHLTRRVKSVLHLCCMTIGFQCLLLTKLLGPTLSNIKNLSLKTTISICYMTIIFCPWARIVCSETCVVPDL